MKILIGAVVLAVFAHAAEAQTSITPLFHKVHNGWAIDVYATNGDGTVRLVAASSTGIQHTFSPSYVGAFKDAAVWNNTYLVTVRDGIGKLDDSVTVLSLLDGTVRDEFFGERVILSPDGRWIVFGEVKFYGDHYPSVALVYDVTQSPDLNRMYRDQRDDPRFQTGWAFYPEENRSSHSYSHRTDDANPPGDVRAHVWIDVNRLVFYAGSLRCNGNPCVVLVDFSRGTTLPMVQSEEVRQADVVDAARLRPTQLPVDVMIVKSIVPTTAPNGQLKVTLEFFQERPIKTRSISVLF